MGDREEGEMSGDEDGEIMSGSEKDRRGSKDYDEDKNDRNFHGSNNESGDDITDEQKAKEERIAASLKKKEEKRKITKKEFKELLKETDDIDRHSHWSDIKKLIDKDERYLTVESSGQRQDWFEDYVQELKDEHRREKDKKKDRSTRSRSRSRERKKSRSRSRSKEKKKRDRSKEKRKKKDKDRSRSKERKRKEKRDREEGEMSGDEDGEIMSG